MPRQPKAQALIVHSAHLEPVSGDFVWLPIDGGSMLPARFKVTFKLEQPTLLVSLTVVTTHSGPEVAHLDIASSWMVDGGAIVKSKGGITSVSLRKVLIDRLLRQAVSMVARPSVSPSRVASPIRLTPDAKIASAAKEYRLAIERASSAPIKEVGIALGYSASQASRFVAAARERGLLGDVGARAQDESAPS